MNTELTQINHQTSQDMQLKATQLDDSLFSKELAPHYMQLASKLASSSLVPKSFQNKPQDLFIAWAMGYQIGLSPEQSMQSIAVINGRPTMWGDDMLALCMVHKDFEDIIEEPVLTAKAVTGYSCTVKRKWRTPVTKVFTLDMAKKAGLLSKPGPWTQYTDRMLQLRARTFALRDSFPDALKGIKSREEVQDYIEGEYKEVEDDLLSRTDKLKHEIQQRKGVINEPESDKIDSQVTSEPPAQKADEDIQPIPMDEVGAGESVASDDSKITIFQIAAIDTIIIDKDIPKERYDAALKYYEVAHITELSQQAADDFIKQLQKL